MIKLKTLLYTSGIIFLLVSCKGSNIALDPPATPVSPGTNLSTSTAENPITPSSTSLPSPTARQTNTPLSTATPSALITAEPSENKGPIIHEQPGEIYETIVSIPIGKDSLIQYEKHQSYQGPNAIAVLQDESFMIADPFGERLLHISTDGLILDTVDLEQLEMSYILDMRVKGDKIYLLVRSYQKLRVHQLALDGALINTEEIPYEFPVGEDGLSLHNVLTGIAIDCNDNIILELAGGSRLFPLAVVQKQTPYDQITQGISCNDQLYSVINPAPGQTPHILAGDTIYETQLTTGFGGFSLLEVFDDGSFYVKRNDVVTDPAIKVDITIHYVDTDGVVKGAARIPRSEFYYYLMRSSAVAFNGEVYALLPRSNSLDIIRLNFYRELEPLIPGAVIPQITVSENTP